MKQEKLHSQNVTSKLNIQDVIIFHEQALLNCKRTVLILLWVLSLLPSSVLHSQVERIEERWKELLKEKFIDFEIDPTNAYFHNEIGSIYEKLGDVMITINRDKANSYYRAAIAHYSVEFTLEPSNINASQNLQRIRNKRAQYGFGKVLQFQIQFSIPSEKDAVRMKARLQKDPNDFEAMQILTLYYESKKNYREAVTIAYYKKTIEREPDQSNAYAALGEAYYQLEKYDHSIVHFMLASNLNPRKKSFHVGLAKAYHKKGKLEIAERIIAKVIENDSTNAEAYFVLGSVLYDKSELLESKKHLKSYLKRDSSGVYAEEAQNLLKEIARKPKSDYSPSFAEKGVHRLSEWNFEMLADTNWQAEDIEVIRETLGSVASSAVLFLMNKNSATHITVEILGVPDHLGIKTPEDFFDFLRKDHPNEMGTVVEPLKKFKLNGYTGAKRVFTMGGFATILQYIFIKGQKAYVINGFDMSARVAQNPSEFREKSAQNRKELEKVMNTFKFLDIEEFNKDKIKKLLRGENPENPALSLIWGVVGRIPLYSEFGVFFEILPLFFSIFWIVVWYYVMRVIEQFAMTTGQPPGCLYAFTQLAQLFYLFCCVRAVF